MDEEEEFDLDSIPVRLSKMGVTLRDEGGIETTRELTTEDWGWVIQTTMQLIEIDGSEDGAEDDSLGDIDPKNLMSMAEILTHFSDRINVDPAHTNFLAFLARRNLIVHENIDDPLYFYALISELYAKWRDISIYVENVSAQRLYDRTYHPDMVELLNQIMQEHHRLMTLDLPLYQTRLFRLAAFILEEAVIYIEHRIIDNDHEGFQDEIGPQIDSMITSLIDEYQEAPFAREESMFRLHHARANLVDAMLMQIWPRIVWPQEVPEVVMKGLLMIRDQTPDNRDNAKAFMQRAYKDLITAADIAQNEISHKPWWKAKVEFELARLWANNHDLDVEEFALLPNWEEHLSRSRDLFDRMNHDDGVGWCDLLWAQEQGDQKMGELSSDLMPYPLFQLR